MHELDHMIRWSASARRTADALPVPVNPLFDFFNYRWEDGGASAGHQTVPTGRRKQNFPKI